MVFFVADDVKRIDEITISTSCGIKTKNLCLAKENGEMKDNLIEI